jgi:hypothetical protein
MKRLAEYKAKNALAVSNAPKNPSREDIMKQKPLHCTPENPEEALIPSPSDSVPSLNNDRMDARGDPKEGMERIFKHYLAHNPAAAITRKRPELEIRFQGVSGAPLTKIDYDSVIQHLYAAGFETSNPNGTHILRISPEYVDERKGLKKISNIRAEITGVDLIQEYCKTNSIQHLLNLPSTLSASANKVMFTQKLQIPIKDDDEKGAKFHAVDNNDFRFRVGYQYENEWGPHSELVRGIIDTKNWSDSKKIFRHLNRVRFSHKTLPIFADITIIRSSAKTGGRKQIMIPQYTIQEAKVFQEPESYEVELEIDNSKVGVGMKYSEVEKLLEDARKGIRIILSAIQGTNYPIGEQEMRRVIQNYQRLLHGDKFDPQTTPPCSFIGPSSRTLQIEHIVEHEGEIGTRPQTPNIRYGYTVTDKADGDRKMLLIDESGKLYLIDMNMRVQFTGSMTAEKKLHFSLFDGEHIKYDKTGRFINLFAIFDVYYVNKKSTREFPFINGSTEFELPKGVAYRWKIMNQAVEMLKPFSILDKNKPIQTNTGKPESSQYNPCSMRVQCKEFYVGSSGLDIFYKCGSILSKMRDGLFEYNTDGLIFTPSEYGVGGDPSKQSGPLYKHTWDRSFKWKPSKYNTIDFLVRLKKDDKGRDFVGSEFEDGLRLESNTTVNQYKTIILHCGFDERKHGYMNPFQQLIDGEFTKNEQAMDEDAEVRPESTYGARPFMPTNPADNKACLCNVKLFEDRTGNFYMCTEEGDYFEENTIVEFRYDETRKGAWRWVPLRVRYDKTAQMSLLCGGNPFKKKKQSFGNDFTTADNNWYSIHNPITEQMLSTGNDIPKPESVGEDVYYNRRTTESTTRGLRDFHNLYVKMRLINGTSNRKDKLIDFAVGKAGDLSKWRNANLGFVFGIDVSKDNIMNRENGACARYLSESSKYHNMPDALFLHGNSAKNIRSGDAFDGHKEKTIAHAVFGEGPKIRADLGANVYKAYGIAQEGFNISSCQFALHYFFENVRTMHNFVRNVAECTRVGGIFVGTCWDGKNIFNLLRNKSCGDSFSISRFGTRVFQITKMYDYTAFPDDELSLGYSISVFQESIGQHIVEYLVNFDFFQRVMENYGFVLMNREEATQFGFPNGGTGMFDGLYYDMMSSISREQTNRYGTAPDMTEDEKFISFLNRYFIFRKVRHVAAEKITKLIEHKMPSKEASKCTNAAERIAPVAYESMLTRGYDSLEEGEEGEEGEDSIHKIAKSFSTREQIAEKERMEEETHKRNKEASAVEKSTQETKKPAAPLHFIRTLGNTKVTIRTYEPLEESSNKEGDEGDKRAKEPMEITNLPIEETEPAIRLVPKTVRVGKTIRVPKPKIQI